MGAEFKKIEQIEQWHVRSEIDPIFDTEDIFATLHDFRHMTSSSSGSLSFRCLEEELSAYISWGEVLKDPGDYNQAVIFRFDTLEPQREVWKSSIRRSSVTHNKYMSTFAPNAMKFMFQATMHERLAARTDDGSKRQLTSIFNLEGVREVVSKVFRACNLSENIPNEDVSGE